MKPTTPPEVKAAVIKGAIVEAIVLVLGMGLFVATQNIVWIVGAVLLGSTAMIMFLVQSGAFNRRDG